jgi:hypothetical protein
LEKTPFPFVGRGNEETCWNLKELSHEIEMGC